MRVILRCFGDEYLQGCDYAVVEITPELMAVLDSRCELARRMRLEDSGLFELSFFTGNCTVYDYAFVRELIEDRLGVDDNSDIHGLDDDGWTVLPDDVDLTGVEPERIELELLQVSQPMGNNEGYFEWYLRPKHSDATATTAQLTLADLREALSMEGIIA